MLLYPIILMEQFLSNLLLNVITCTSDKSKVVLNIFENGDFFVIIVYDN
jgi:hypothetical protein